MNLEDYDAVKVNPCSREIWSDNNESFSICEPDDPALYCWSVYLHLKEGGVMCVADCASQEHANVVADGLRLLLKEAA